MVCETMPAGSSSLPTPSPEVIDAFPLPRPAHRIPILTVLLVDASKEEDILLPCSTLARWFNLDYEALRSRLRRWSRFASHEPAQREDRPSKSAGVFYNLREVLPIIRALIRDREAGRWRATSEREVAKN